MKNIEEKKNTTFTKTETIDIRGSELRNRKIYSSLYRYYEYSRYRYVVLREEMREIPFFNWTGSSNWEESTRRMRYPASFYRRLAVVVPQHYNYSPQSEPPIAYIRARCIASARRQCCLRPTYETTRQTWKVRMQYLVTIIISRLPA